MTAQALPDPSCYFVPAYDIKDAVQQIRIVIEGMAGQVPTALVALTVIFCAQHLMNSFCLEGIGAWRGAADDRDIAWSHAGADICALRIFGPRYCESVRCSHR